jgi:transcriptional regulator with XRE-family HTH domain
MSAERLKEWMKRNGKTSVDVASATKVSPTTVDRYLAGNRVRRIIEAAFERLVNEDERDSPKTA